MRKSAVYALKRALAEGFIILRDSELHALDALPGWMTRLFTALLRCTEYSTGRGETSYLNLQALLTPIQPRSGPKHFVPDMQALKKAVRLLEERGLIRRDKLTCMDACRLVFVTMPRVDQTRPKAELKPRTRTPAKRADTNSHRASEAAGAGTQTPDSNPSSAVSLLHIADGNLSTDGGIPRPPEPDTPPGPILVARGGKFGPPRGADHCPLDAGTPPRPSRTVRAMRAQLKGEKIDPPGGQVDAPQGGGAALPPSARIRRPKKAVLRDEAGQGPAAAPPEGDQDGPSCAWPRLRDSVRWMEEQAARQEAQDGQ